MVGFFDDSTIKKVPINGGPALIVAEAGEWPRGADWGAAGSIVFATRETGTGLFRVSAAGGSPEVLTTPDSDRGELGHWWPTWLPGNRAVLFTIITDVRAQVETAQLGLLELETGAWRTILPYGSSPRYVPTGHLVYAFEGRLWAVPFDLEQLEVTGTPVALGAAPRIKGTGAVDAVVSGDGTLWYVQGDPLPGSASERLLLWVDRAGAQEALPHEPMDLTSLSVSPVANRVAVESRDDAWDIWVAGLDQPEFDRLTFDPARDKDPLWTPDGQRVVFTSNRHGRPNLYIRRADGTGDVTRLTESRSEQIATSISPDGTVLVFTEVDPGARWDIGLIGFDEPGSVELILDSPFREQNGVISPNGRWLALPVRRSGPGRDLLARLSSC